MGAQFKFPAGKGSLVPTRLCLVTLCPRGSAVPWQRETLPFPVLLLWTQSEVWLLGSFRAKFKSFVHCRCASLSLPAGEGQSNRALPTRLQSLRGLSFPLSTAPSPAESPPSSQSLRGIFGL